MLRPVESSSAAGDTDIQTLVLRTSRIVVPDFAAISTSTRTPLPGPPLRLGGYEVRRELGRGGMGIVYEGYDPKLRRTVALKVLKDAGPSDPELLKRFKTEAEAVAQLQHPNIVQVIEVGTHDGLPFVALEYLAGGSLHQIIGGRPQSPDLAADLMLTLVTATAHAHAHGVLHRDLKPANILFTADDVPKLTDFGAARLFGPGMSGCDSENLGLTRAGEVIGTPQYMAPEQAWGTPDATGPPADIYSLGAILYELLTGRPPFTGVDPIDVIQAVRTSDPLPPRSLQPKVPRDLETICLKCLEKDPKRRYSSANELANDLTRFLAGDPIRARSVSPIRRLWVRAKRHPASAGMIAGLIVAGLIGLTAFGWQFRATAAARDQAMDRADELKLANLETEAKRIEAEKNLNTAVWNLYCGAIAQVQLLIEKASTTDAGSLLDAVAPELRGWEWKFLRGQCGDSLWNVHFPTSLPATGVSWIHKQTLSPDGTQLAVVTVNPYPDPGKDWLDNPCTLSIFRIADGVSVRVLVGAFPAAINHLFWSSPRTVTGIDVRGNERTWNVAEGVLAIDRPTKFSPHERQPVLQADSGQILRSDMTGLVEVIDPLTSRTVAHQTGMPGTLAFALSPDGTRVAVTCNERSDGLCLDRVLELPSGRILAEWLSSGTHTKFSPDGRWVIAAPREGRSVLVTVLDAKTMAVAWKRSLPGDRYAGCRFSPDGHRVVVVMQGRGEMHAFDVATGENPTVFRGHDGVIRDLSYSPDGSWLVTVGDDNLVRLWNPDTGAPLGTLRGHQRGVRTCTFTPDGRKVITGGADERLFCWDLTRTRSAGGVMPPHRTGGESTRLGAIGYRDGRLAVFQTDVGLTEFDPATANPVIHRMFPTIPLRDAKELRDYGLSADGTLLGGRTRLLPPCTWIEGADGTDVALWDVATGQPLKTFWTGFSRLFTVALSPDGTRIAAGGDRRQSSSQPAEPHLLVWDCQTGQLLSDIQTDAKIIGLTFSAKDNRLAVGFARHQRRPGPAIRIFDAGMKPICDVPPFAPPEPDALVVAMEFSPDGTILVGSCWRSGMLFALDPATATIRKIIPITSPLTGFAFSPDGTRLATTGYTDKVTIRETNSWDEVANFICAPGRVDDWAFPALVAFSPDGCTLAATHWNGDFSLWHAPALENSESSASLIRRAVSDESAFRFHLAAALEATGQKRTFAYDFHARRLAELRPPTNALADKWVKLRALHLSRPVLPTLFGGVIVGASP